MLGDPDSCGIWAPCLTHDDGLFYLVYTDVKRYGRTTVGGASGASLRDFHNYLVTSPTIDGDWSDPGLPQQQRLRPFALSRRRRAQVPGQHAVGPSAGPEPVRRHRPAGVLGRRAPADRRAPIIFEGTPLGFTEAPHLYKRDGLLLPDHRRRRHRLGSRGDDGALAHADRARTSCTRTSTS